MNNQNMSILIVDDNQGFVKRISGMLGELHTVPKISAAGNFDEAVEAWESRKPDLVLLDISLPGKSGLSFLKKIRETDQRCAVIVISNFSGSSYRDKCEKLGALYFLDKTGEFDRVPAIVQGAMDFASWQSN